MKDKKPATPAATAQTSTEATNFLRGTTSNVTSNIGRGIEGSDIATFRSEGIDVDNEDPAPENAVPPTAEEVAAAQEDIGQWFKPTICAQKADATVSDAEGSWKKIAGVR